MRVAVLFDNFGPYHLARLSAASAVMDVLAVEFGGSSHDYVWEKPEAARSLKTETLFPDRTSREVSTEEFNTRLHQVLNEFRPAAVAIPGWSGRGAFLALTWCLQNRVPAIVMSESTAHDEARSGWREFIKRRYVSLCSAALVGGTPHREYLIRLGMDNSRIFLGYDAVDNRYFNSHVSGIRAEKPIVKAQYDLPDQYFLASARFIEKKNLSRLIDAYAHYREEFATRNPEAQAWDLVLLGDGELRPALESQLVKLGLQDSVKMPGFVQYPDLPAYYGMAKVFIHASTTEQWGLVVNEAMASGLPVLVSNRCGSASDLVEEGANGYSFDPVDKKQLAALMLKMSTCHADEFARFGEASSRNIAEWGPERFASGLQTACVLAASRPKPRAGILDRLLLNLLINR